jgi:hypothetical protein
VITFQTDMNFNGRYFQEFIAVKGGSKPKIGRLSVCFPTIIDMILDAGDLREVS